MSHNNVFYNNIVLVASTPLDRRQRRSWNQLKSRELEGRLPRRGRRTVENKMQDADSLRNLTAVVAGSSAVVA